MSIEEDAAVRIQKLVAQLHAGDNNASQKAAWLLAMSEKQVLPLAEALKSEKPVVRKWAAWALMKMGPGAKDAASEIQTVLNDSDATVRLFALQAITNIGIPTAEAVPALLKMLYEPLMAEVVTKALSKMGLPALTQVMQAVGRKQLTEAQARPVLEAIRKQLHEDGASMKKGVVAVPNPQEPRMKRTERRLA